MIRRWIQKEDELLHTCLFGRSLRSAISCQRKWLTLAKNCNIFSVLSISNLNPDKTNNKFVTSWWFLSSHIPTNSNRRLVVLYDDTKWQNSRIAMKWRGTFPLVGKKYFVRQFVWRLIALTWEVPFFWSLCVTTVHHGRFFFLFSSPHGEPEKERGERDHEVRRND